MQLPASPQPYRLADRYHGADGTTGFARHADDGAEVHEGLVEVEHVPDGQQGAGDCPQVALHRVALEVATADEDAKEDARHVGVENGRPLAEREAENRARRVVAYSFEGS